jgi:hypothetical protein
MTSGHDAGFKVTLEPFFKIGDKWRIGIEAGPYIHRDTFAVTVTNWYASNSSTPQTIGVAYVPRWRVDYVIGASVSRGNFSLQYDYYRASGASGDTPLFWSSVQVLMATYRF